MLRSDWKVYKGTLEYFTFMLPILILLMLHSNLSLPKVCERPCKPAHLSQCQSLDGTSSLTHPLAWLRVRKYRNTGIQMPAQPVSSRQVCFLNFVLCCGVLCHTSVYFSHTSYSSSVEYINLCCQDLLPVLIALLPDPCIWSAMID
jgi:hypothetical protein